MKILIFGSAWYIPNWFQKNKSQLVNIDEIWCINNSISYISKFIKVNKWVISSDFLENKYLENSLFNIYEFCNFKEYGLPIIQSGDFLGHPYGYDAKFGGTMLFNVCIDILNKSILRNHSLTVGLVGCDLIYNRSQTHFYNDGKPDPLRLGTEYLINILNKINDYYNINNKYIYNLSEQDETLLPFVKLDAYKFIIL